MLVAEQDIRPTATDTFSSQADKQIFRLKGAAAAEAAASASAAAADQPADLI